MSDNINNPPLVIASGTYTGNNTADRAIPHGLGRIPKFVFIWNIGQASFWHLLSNTSILMNHTVAWAVTAPTSANFYVGNAGSYAQSANENGQTFNWTAI